MELPSEREPSAEEVDQRWEEMMRQEEFDEKRKLTLRDYYAGRFWPAEDKEEDDHVHARGHE
jgi:hypothetical protein